MISEQRGRKIRLKRFCLFDSKRTGECGVCISDLVPNTEAQRLLGFFLLVVVVVVVFFSLSLPDLHR